MSMKRLLVLIGLLLAKPCFATAYVVNGVDFFIYVQSRQGSTANMIEVRSPLLQGAEHPWCGRRLYIDFSDKELFEAAFAYSQGPRKVNIIFEDFAPSQVIAGHTITMCKLMSIFRAQ